LHLPYQMMYKLPLSKWAEREGVSRMTAWRMATSGSLPGAKLSPAGRWYVEVDEPEAIRLTVAYARVSSDDQKSDLDRQVARIAEWTTEQGIRVDRYIREIGSGLNDKRRELASILADPSVQTIVVEHRDRLARFGVAQLERVMAAANRSVIVVDAGEREDDLVRDMIDLMTCFSARLYGRRSARNRAERALSVLRP
jgi:putative resolvase